MVTMVRRFSSVALLLCCGLSISFRATVLPAVAPGIGGYISLLACAASIAGGSRAGGMAWLHGSMETLAIGSYATPLFSTASSTLLLGVTLGMPFWIGVALVVVGSLINVWFARRR